MKCISKGLQDPLKVRRVDNQNNNLLKDARHHKAIKRIIFPLDIFFTNKVSFLSRQDYLLHSHVHVYYIILLTQCCLHFSACWSVCQITCVWIHPLTHFFNPFLNLFLHSICKVICILFSSLKLKLVEWKSQSWREQLLLQTLQICQLLPEKHLFTQVTFELL